MPLIVPPLPATIDPPFPIRGGKLELLETRSAFPPETG